MSVQPAAASSAVKIYRFKRDTSLVTVLQLLTAFALLATVIKAAGLCWREFDFFRLLKHFPHSEPYINALQSSRDFFLNARTQEIITLTGEVARVALIYLALPVTLILFYRAAANLLARGGTISGFTPGWCLIWLLVPVFCLWKPYQAIRAIFGGYRMQPADAAPSASVLLKLWWGAFLAVHLAGAIAGKYAGKLNLLSLASAKNAVITLGAANNAVICHLALSLLMIVELILFFLLLRMYRRESANSPLPVLSVSETFCIQTKTPATQADKGNP